MSKPTYYYMLRSPYSDNPILFDGQVPIFWRKSVAAEELKSRGISAAIVRVRLEIHPRDLFIAPVALPPEDQP